MGSMRAAEKLTYKVLKSAFFILKEAGELTADTFYETLERSLPSELNRSLERKGGHQELRRIINEAKRQGYIHRDSRSSRSSITLTDRGSDRLLRLLEDEEFSKITRGKWDGMWRILTYDIPEAKRPARDAVRRLVTTLGFVQLHRSVWVIPYDCSRQVALIQEAHGIHHDITLLVVNDFDRANEFKKIFDLL